MDIQQMIVEHAESGAAMTVAAIPVPAAEARAFGVIGVDAQHNMTAFLEKPEIPPEMPDRPGWVLASMGNYIWRTKDLIAELLRDARAEEGSQHDFGRNILPALLGRLPVHVYDFARNTIPGQEERERGYWRDVGTIGAYYEANMDLVSVVPIFDLYNQKWPIRTWARPNPPAKFVFSDAESKRMGIATDSLVCEGCIISGGRIDRTVLSPNVRVNSFAHVEQSILLEGVNVGRHAKVRRAIIDKDVQIPEGVSIGHDHEEDRRRGLTVSDDLVVVPKGYQFT
jgi:glucose-1-phosphate adenylyltransferase